jgi:YD repeat-containing protein
MSQADRSGKTLFITRDSQGRVTTQTLADPAGAVQTYRFASGYNTEATDGVGQPANTLRAAGTHLVQAQTDRLERTTQLQHDAAGNLTLRTDALGPPWAFTYDPSFNQLLTSTDPLNQTTTFGDDGKGDLTSITDPLNHTTAFCYNAAGDLTSVTFGWLTRAIPRRQPAIPY